ncbi:type II toxin-antitoxin system PemK/MazF family toxin [Streptobacillus felis]|uniref:Type II toxin-antitoxin system PemK/MazF family toxin n=1 Tax=Streptobacillus felis TaxID=1384509 RepID=A0A7Z0TC00_9FUSO|nr:type II toxin-antitoxin system PemK/MazF family toxin [Streptobacillus felis]NYV27908.1 type II toxin-antitoxin system PemK/MazF family toxin [Streptobacillus felis]
MIGKMFIALFPYFDIGNKRKGIKERPVLVIGETDDNDCIILPVSTITKKQYYNPEYDIEIDPEKFPKLNLSKLSYIRVHKQAIIYKRALHKEIGNLKEEYNIKYVEIIKKLEGFNKNLVYNS